MKQTIKDLLRDNEVTKGFIPSYDLLNELGTNIYLTFIESNKGDKKFIDKILNSKEYNDQFLTQILNKRVEVWELQDKIDNAALAMYHCFNIPSPGAAVIYLIDLLEFYETNGRKATVDDMANIYPLGFYNKETLIFIIDNITKQKLSVWSNIY